MAFAKRLFGLMALTALIAPLSPVLAQSYISVSQLPTGWVQAHDSSDWVNLTRLKVEGPPHNNWGCETPAKISSTARAKASFRAHFVSTPHTEEIKSTLEEYQKQATSQWSNRWGKPNIEWHNIMADGSNLQGLSLWISFPYKPGVGNCGGGGFNDSIISSLGKAFMSFNGAMIKIEFDYAINGGIKGFMDGSDEEWMIAQSRVIRAEIETIIKRLIISTRKKPEKKIVPESNQPEKPVISMVVGYELYFDGKLVSGDDPGPEKRFTRQQAQENCNWNMQTKPHIHIRCVYNGEVLGDRVGQKSVVNINPVSNYLDYLIYQNCQPPNLEYSYYVNQHGVENFQPVSIKKLVLKPDKYILWVYGGRRAFVRVGTMIGGQKTLIEAAVSDDKYCHPKPAVFTVPIGMLATGFYVERLESGLNCENYSLVLERGYHICRFNPGTGTNTNDAHCPQGMTRNPFVDGCMKIKMGPSTYNPDQEPIGVDPADLPPLPKN
ncbi:MAG: hypothetical protein QG599_1461 [Pseudomonadota bacterium]|nr:hypothetical protein [Pseudomonadota bacterium]